jgi:c-di-GMP-binding flagellar brake protein YcgR
MDLEQCTAGISARQSERRSALRLPVDEDSVFVIVGYSAPQQARLLDLSLEGCRLRAQATVAVRAGQPIEVFFRLNGVPFRMGGVVQAIHDRNTVGIRFLDLSDRKRQQLLDLIGEIQQFHAEQAAAGQAASEGIL